MHTLFGPRNFYCYFREHPHAKHNIYEHNMMSISFYTDTVKFFDAKLSWSSKILSLCGIIWTCLRGCLVLFSMVGLKEILTDLLCQEWQRILLFLRKAAMDP